jgi:branched-chain amino acid transport system ATP-binding protein
VALLEARGLRVRFGGVAAIDGLDLSIDAGSIVGLIGPNGAGKTTCIDALTGFVRAQGSVIFDGVRIDALAPHRRARLGLSRTWQSLELFDDLTVRENVLVAAESNPWYRPLLDLVHPHPRPSSALADHALDLLELAPLANGHPDEISQGHRKLVGVARALACRARLVLLDEPAAGLDSTESAAFGDKLRALADEALTILLVDHDMGLVLDVCQHVHVLEFGHLIASGSPDEVRADPAVVAAYLGEHQ